MADEPRIDPDVPEAPEGVRQPGDDEREPSSASNAPPPGGTDRPLGEEITRDVVENSGSEEEGGISPRGPERGGGVNRPR